LRSFSDIAIGELSRRTRCNIETIRYYERIGLQPLPRRQGGRYRRYDVDDIGRLRFSRRARQLGFTLDEIRALLRLAIGDGEHVRMEVRSLAASHVADVRAKIAHLQAMERVLTDAICKCDTGQQPRSPLIEVLSGDQAEIAHPLGSRDRASTKI
jgi:MerR family mercuric resistance operon transcriptional regulator